MNPATVDINRGAGHKVVLHDEHDACGDFFRRTRPGNQIFRRCASQHFRSRVSVVAKHRRIDHARTDNINALGCQLRCHGAHELLNRTTNGSDSRLSGLRPKPGQAAIASVGGAVEQFVRAVAPELAPKRINVVSPGVIDTPMFGNDADARAKMLAGATAKNLIPRAGTPEEVAAGIMFVVQNDFVTGTTIDVDGGWVHA